MEDNNSHEESISNPDEHKGEVESASNLSGETPQASPDVKRLRRWYLIAIPLLLVALAIFMPAIGLAVNDSLGFWDIREIGTQLLEHVEKNDQRITAAKWCDVMLKREDDYNSFKRYKDNKENFPYTLNKHILGHNEIPDNMVVLFSGVSGWNQFGDSELAQKRNRSRVFFGNGDSRTVRRRQIPYLRWKYEDSGVIPGPNIKLPLVIFTVLLAIVFLSISIKHRKCLKVFWGLALGIAIISACAGGFLGFAAEEAYYKLNAPGNLIAPWIGGFWGFVIGVSFVAIIGSIYKKYNAKVSMLGYATVIGIITGIAASSMVHGYLMIVYGEENFLYMVSGSCFGIMAGFLLGWVSSGLIRFYKNNTAILNTATDSMESQ